MNPSSSSNFISGFSNSTRKNPKDLKFNATAGNRSSVKGGLSKPRMAKVRRQETRAASGMDNRGGGSDMSGLAEGCVANIMSFTSPRDACRFSVVSSLFRSAAESDIIWERFLPPDYESIVARSPQSSTLLSSPSKKQLYVTLCNNPILIDNGRKTFWLDKWSGKKCYMLSARDLAIVWGDTPPYWRWISDPTSRFEEVAELINVCWLQINGKIDTGMLSPSTLYAAYIVFKLTRGAYGLDYTPAELAVGPVGGESCKRTVYLQPENWPRRRQVRGPIFGRGRRFGLLNGFLESSETVESNAGRGDAKERGDGWLEIELGEFFCEESGLGELEMSIMEVKGGGWKNRLIVGGIEIRPKEGK